MLAYAIIDSSNIIDGIRIEGMLRPKSHELWVVFECRLIFLLMVINKSDIAESLRIDSFLGFKSRFQNLKALQISPQSLFIVSPDMVNGSDIIEDICILRIVGSKDIPSIY